MIIINDEELREKLVRITRYLQDLHTRESKPNSHWRRETFSYFVRHCDYEIPRNVVELLNQYHYRFFFTELFLFMRGSSGWKIRYRLHFNSLKGKLYGSNDIDDFNYPNHKPDFIDWGNDVIDAY
jgi:hypothetical protein